MKYYTNLTPEQIEGLRDYNNETFQRIERINKRYKDREQERINEVLNIGKNKKKKR